MITFNKIAVVNFSGNVGKSTLAKHLLAPMMGDCPVISVETINADAASDHRISGSRFGELQEGMLTQDKVVVDVGSSNIEDFLKLMRRYEGSHEDFDLYVVPCVPALKQQKDTLQCVRELSALGIPAQRIRIVFNQLPDQVKPEAVFGPIFEFAKVTHLALVHPSWAIYESDIFGKITGQNRSLAELANDPTDYKALIAVASNAEQKLQLAGHLSIKRLSQGVRRNMLAVYESLTAV